MVYSDIELYKGEGKYYKNKQKKQLIFKLFAVKNLCIWRKYG